MGERGEKERGGGREAIIIFITKHSIDSMAKGYTMSTKI